MKTKGPTEDGLRHISERGGKGGGGGEDTDGRYVKIDSLSSTKAKKCEQPHPVSWSQEIKMGVHGW